MNVINRVVLVTGSGSGMGKTTIKLLAKKGAKVVVNDLDKDKISQVVNDIRLTGGSAIGIKADITDKQNVERMFEEIIDTYGTIDILINNAGIGGNMSIRKMTEEYWDKVVDINMKGVFLCTQAASKYMVNQGYGRILNISSRAWLGWFGQTSYAASKGGVVSYTRSSAIELGKYGITVNCIAPGLIETPLLMEQPQELIDRLLKAQPSGEIGKTEDVAWAALYLVSDESGYVTGQVLYVCGGKSLYAQPDVD